MLRKLAGENQPDGRLDLARGDSRLLVVAREPGRLEGDLLEDVVDERVHDAHRLGGDAGVRVHLLEHLVDVDLVGLSLGLLLRLLTLEEGAERTTSASLTHERVAGEVVGRSAKNKRGTGQTRGALLTLPEPPLVVFFAGFLLAGFLSAIFVLCFLSLLSLMCCCCCCCLSSSAFPPSRCWRVFMLRIAKKLFPVFEKNVLFMD